MEKTQAHRRRVVIAATLALAMCVANALLHLHISRLCDELFRRTGRAAYEWITLIGIVGLTLLAAAPFLRRRSRPQLGTRALMALALLAAAGVAAQESLLVSNVELIHFPQFGLLAGLFLAAGLGAQAAWALATLAGVGDEAYQYFVIYAGLPKVYLDFNDMVLNSLGAAYAACLVALGAGSPRSFRPASARWRRCLLLALALVPVLAWIDPPQLAPYWQPAMTGRLYRVMSAPEGLFFIVLIGLVVAWAAETSTGGAQARGEAREPGAVAAADPAPPPSNRDGLSAVLCILALMGAATPARADVAAGRGSPSGSDSFLITFWCGPPPGEFDDRRAAEIAAAGFTVVGAPCEGASPPRLNRRALDVAARHGLRMWVKDPRLNGYRPLAHNWRQRVANAVALYGKHPALAGYFIVDEPGAGRFADLALLVGRLRELAPDRLAYINLFPDYAPPDYLEAPTYEEYVERYLRTVRPALLSYDNYPFEEGRDRPSFFANLWTIRTAAARHRIPFMLIVLAMPHLSYRDPTEAELAWQVHHALAFGARGISYFTYWTPLDRLNNNKYGFRYGLIENGKPTLHYFQAARINRTVAAVGAELARYRSWGVLDSRGEVAASPPYGPLRAIAGGAVTAGVFVGPRAELALLLVNRDYRYGVDAELLLAPGAVAPAVFDPSARSWSKAADLTFELPPAGLVLVRWDSSDGTTATVDDRD